MHRFLNNKIGKYFGSFSLSKDWDTVVALLENETDACVLCTFDGDIVYMNTSAQAFFGNKPLHETILDRAVEEEANRLGLAKLDAAIKSKAETAVELALRPKSQTLDFWEWFLVSIRQIGVGTLWRVSDITARRSVDAIIRQEIQELNEFLDVLPIGLYQTDSGGNIYFINQRLSEWLGYTHPRELKGKKLFDLLTGGHFPELDGLWHGDLTFRTQSGTFFTAFVSHAIYDENGETMLRAAVVRDVKKQSEQELSAKEVELGFSWLFEEAPVGIAFIDTENHVNEANGALFSMFECKRDDLVGAHLHEYIDAEDWSDLENKIAKVKMGVVPRAHSEVRLKTSPDKLEKIAGVFVTPMTTAGTDGLPDIAGVITHFIDNTQRRNLEMQFSQAQKMQAIGQLAGGLAHDFNNLLTAILGSTDLLLQTRSVTSPDFEELMNIHNSASRAGNLVGQLLSYSRKQRLKPIYLDVTEILAELKHMLVRLLGSKVLVQLEHGRNLGFIRVDKTQFEQVFVNLAVNARDAMPNGGTFTLRTYVEKVSAKTKVLAQEIMAGEYVVIDVLDTGVGIDENILSRIFEPFFTTKTGGADSGTGLGLAMVYGNISQTGGSIVVKSTKNVGTTFSIYLPRYSLEQVKKLTEQALKEAATQTTPKDKTYNTMAVQQFMRVKPVTPEIGEQLAFEFLDLRKTHLPRVDTTVSSGVGVILLVEDEDGVRAVTKRALTGKGYTVIECTCAEEALEKINDGLAFNLLITDMVMPGMDGVSLASEIRAKNQETKVLMISGFSQEAARGEIQDLPDFHFLAKPFSLKDLIEKVKHILEHN